MVPPPKLYSMKLDKNGRILQSKFWWICFCCHCCFYFVLLRTKSKDWLARNKDNMSEWGDMSILELVFQ